VTTEEVAIASGAGAPPIVLTDVVITATRNESATFDVPATVEVLDVADLQQRKLARTVPEALHAVPGVMVQKTGHGQGSPYIRGFTGFRTLFLIDGMIIRAPTGTLTEDGLREVTKRNSGDGFVHGVELSGSLRLPADLTAFGAFAWLEGEVDAFITSDGPAVRAPISRLMPPTLTFGLRWEPEARLGWLEGEVTAAGEADRLSPGDASDTQRIPPGGTPGYGVLTLRGGLEIRDGLTLTAVVENITDEDYRIHGSGQNEPGTNFVIGLDWRI
jgi:outer membrane receptor protein involved in Fe transport